MSADVPNGRWSLRGARARWYKVKETDHGILLDLEGTMPRFPCPESLRVLRGLRVDAFGEGLFWSPERGDMESLARYGYLPYSLGPHVEDVSVHELDESGCRRFSMSVRLATKSRRGEFGVRQHTVWEFLQGLQRHNSDRLFCLEFFGSSSDVAPVFRLVTRPSLVAASLSCGGSDVAWHGEAPDFHAGERARTWRGMARWVLLPVLTMLFSAAVLGGLCGETVERLPRIVYLPHADDPTARLSEALPPIPDTFVQTWDLAQLARSLSVEGTDPADLLVRAQEVLQRKTPVTGAQLLAVREYLVKREGRRSPASRVLGLFNFVNVLWAFSIVGITVTLGPALWAISRPIRRIVIMISTKLWHRVLLPLLKTLNRLGVLEAGAQTLCVLLTVDGYRAPPEWGWLVSSTGVALCTTLCFLYSTWLWVPGSFFRRARLTRTVGFTSASVLWAMWATHFRSSLMGFVAVYCLFVTLGFSAAGDHLVYFIGWDRTDQLIRALIASSVLLSGFICLQIFGHLFLNQFWLDSIELTFSFPVQVMGTLTLLLALLVLSCGWYRGTWGAKYWLMQVTMVSVVLVLAGAGTILGMSGLSNTALVFAFLYACEKASEAHLRWLRWDPWVLSLILFVFLWRAALWLHVHPKFVVSLFTI